MVVMGLLAGTKTCLQLFFSLDFVKSQFFEPDNGNTSDFRLLKGY
jgi:hypothetical protein